MERKSINRCQIVYLYVYFFMSVVQTSNDFRWIVSSGTYSSERWSFLLFCSQLGRILPLRVAVSPSHRDWEVLRASAPKMAGGHELTLLFSCVRTLYVTLSNERREPLIIAFNRLMIVLISMIRIEKKLWRGKSPIDHFSCVSENWWIRSRYSWAFRTWEMKICYILYKLPPFQHFQCFFFPNIRLDIFITS